MTYWFTTTKYRLTTRLAFITFGLAFIVILLGAYTRLTDAGLSCPDWPHCYGYLTAPHTNDQLQSAIQKYPLAPINIKKAWTEMTHRYFAGMEGILILVLSFSMLFSRKAGVHRSKLIAISLIGLLTIQVTLGMLTVTEKLKPVIVLSHLLTGLSLLSILWWACLDLGLHEEFFVKKTKPRITPWLFLGFIILIFQITLGGWVSTHYAGLACIDFPFCNGNIIPTMQWQHLNTDLITIHMLHRFGAVITATYLMVISYFLFRYSLLRPIAILIFILVITQFSLGVLNILLLRPVWIALTHHAVAILLLLTMITALVKSSFIRDYSRSSA